MSSTDLHLRNRHSGRYDMEALVAIYPPLERYVATNKYGDLSINFFDPEAVKALNRALLAHHYGIEFWEIPPHALTPPIPGRADYIHYMADVVGVDREGVRCLDIGVGANCIYPIIGHCEYGWEFVGSDVECASLESAQRIVDGNSVLRGHIELRHQPHRKSIFRGVIEPEDQFDLTICNPPFHDSRVSAAKAASRKVRNLGGGGKRGVKLNFGGRDNELWCEGGERRFVMQMIAESVEFRSQCRYFSTLISNEDNLAPLRRELTKCQVVEQRVIEMAQGNKRSRILVWRF